MTVLEHIRRRSKAVARAILPPLAFVWLSAAASPCVGMVTDSVSRGDVAPAVHNHDETSPLHDHGASSSGHQTSHEHQGCPHCPVGLASDQIAPSGSHIPCNVLDKVSDNSRTAGAPVKVDLKHVLPVAADLLSSATLVSFGSYLSPASQQIAPQSLLPLNVRYCVFLN